MDILSALNSQPANGLRKTEYVRLVRMGYHDAELDGASKYFYQEVINEYNRRNRAYAVKGDYTKINIWKAPIQPRQIEMLESYGFTVDERARQLLTDGEVRDTITIIQIALGNKRFVDAYLLWLKDSSKDGTPKFTPEDVKRMHKILLQNQQERQAQPPRPTVVPDIQPEQIHEETPEPYQPESLADAFFALKNSDINRDFMARLNGVA